MLCNLHPIVIISSTDIQEQLKSGSSESSALVAEVSQLKEELRRVSTKLEQSTDQVWGEGVCGMAHPT